MSFMLQKNSHPVDFWRRVPPPSYSLIFCNVQTRWKWRGKHSCEMHFQGSFFPKKHGDFHSSLCCFTFYHDDTTHLYASVSFLLMSMEVTLVYLGENRPLCLFNRSYKTINECIMWVLSRNKFWPSIQCSF